MAQILVKNCKLVNKGKVWDGTSILIDGDRIKQVFHQGEDLPEASKSLDATGLLCLPGIIDDQVHFRDPGLTHKGDINSESKAALLGGVTSFMDMPNTMPQTTTPDAWQAKMDLGAKNSWINYAFYFGATNDNSGFIREMTNNPHVPGVKVFMGASTGNMLVDNDEALERIFCETNGIVATHCEDEGIIKQNKSYYVQKYGEDPEVKWHPFIRSREACLKSSQKAISLGEAMGTNLHILHLSTKEEIELIQKSSPNISAEVCVHHLWFDDSDYEALGTKIKWNPAVKTGEDREALRAAVRDGIINIVATDHAPHLPSEKIGGALKAASGGPLIQHSLLMMLQLVRENIFSLERLVEVMCHAPADRFCIVDRGYVDPGYFADLVLVDPNSSWSVSKENIASKCGWSPLEGYTFFDQVKYVFINGRLMLNNGKIVSNARGGAMPLSFKKS